MRSLLSSAAYWTRSFSSFGKKVPTTRLPFRNVATRVSLGICGVSIATVGVAEADTRYSDDDDRLPLVYDHIAIENYWSDHKCIAVCRIATILRKILPFMISSLWQFKFGDHTVRQVVGLQSAFIP